MASTITSATLTVTLTEKIELNGRDQGATNTLNISSIKDVSKRIVTVPASGDTTVLRFRATTSAADNALDLQNVKYFRITNLDDTNSVNLSLQIDIGEDDSGADAQATILLEAGRSFIMGTPEDGIVVHDSTSTIQTTLNDLESIIIDSGTEIGTVEVFTASS
tara:strand:+ start:693 stop:1181 length:489 start_codon:yes stop_codon:yes gene_type:complete